MTRLRCLAEDVRARFPELNVLVANAGISRAENMAADGWDVSAAQAIVETNIMGVLRVTAELLPLLKRQPDAAIMATSSNLARQGTALGRARWPLRRYLCRHEPDCGVVGGGGRASGAASPQQRGLS
ncbi:SDR family NAD(P)-dependent oxidoreductase [Variovorax sp. YR566]|uniref:SDR family NAD(P)-dependent oxidoreductase n=1 Tax=Variovorax sp. YR566 TaxID=3450237 RepID=UPI003F81FE1C